MVRLKAGILLLLSGMLACSGEREEAVEEAAPIAVREPAVWVSVDRRIDWRPWNEAALQEARRLDRPVLLYLAAPGCEGLFAEDSSALPYLVEQRFVGIRVDPFQRPDLARRYRAGGWPALVFLLPDGRPFATAVDIPARNVELFLLRMAEAWEERREILEEKVARAQRSEGGGGFPIDVERVYEACAKAFDSRYGGFGRGRKFPETGVLRFLLEYGERTGERAAAGMVERTLDGMLASPLVDGERGGICAYSHTPDWRTPVREKDAFDQAGMLAVLLGAGADYDGDSERLLDYVARELFDAERGAFRGRQVGLAGGEWWTDPRIYVDRHAELISACAQAARERGDERAGRMARAAGGFLLDRCIDGEDASLHLCGSEGVRGLLEDQLLVARALLDLGDLTGERRFADRGRAVFHFAEERLFDRRADAFVERAVKGSVLRSIIPYRDGLVAAGNPLAAELYGRMGSTERARQLLEGRRLVEKAGRAHGSAARVLLHITDESPDGDRAASDVVPEDPIPNP